MLSLTCPVLPIIDCVDLPTQDDFQDSDDTTEDEAEEIVGWGDRSRRESAQSIGESSVHSSLFGGEPHLQSKCFERTHEQSQRVL